MKIETLLPLNRESRDQDHQPLIQGSSYSLWSRLGGGQSVEVAQYLVKAGAKPLQRSGYNRCLSVSSATLMKAQQIAPDSRQARRFQPVKHGLEPAHHPLRAGYYGRGRALHRRYTGEQASLMGMGAGYNACAPTATPTRGLCAPPYPLIDQKDFCRILSDPSRRLCIAFYPF